MKNHMGRLISRTANIILKKKSSPIAFGLMATKATKLHLVAATLGHLWPEAAKSGQARLLPQVGNNQGQAGSRPVPASLDLTASFQGWIDPALARSSQPPMVFCFVLFFVFFFSLCFL